MQGFSFIIINQSKPYWTFPFGLSGTQTGRSGRRLRELRFFLLYTGGNGMLNIKKTVENEKACFQLEGRLDTITSPELEKELVDSLDNVKELVLDFEALDYLSSAGLRVLLSTQKRMSRQGSMKLVHVNDTIMEIFEVTGFTDILTIE